jgi:hypothetical protein
VSFAINAETLSYNIIIVNHEFHPKEITIPSGKKIKLVIDNQDPTPEEFESHDLKREKVINGKAIATIFIGPLAPGRYHFFGEFNADTANGYVIAK